MITMAGLGPGDPGMISIAAAEALAESGNIWLRTGRHPAVEWLNKKKINFSTFDSVYMEADNFQEVYRRIAGKVIEMGRDGDVLYVLPGHPLVAEESADLIIAGAAAEGVPVRIIPGMSFLDALVPAVELKPGVPLHIVDGLRLDEQPPDTAAATVVTQVYSRMVMSEVKLSLMDYYPDDHTVMIVSAAGIPGLEHVEKCPLYNLDRTGKADHLTSVFVPPLQGGGRVRESRYPLDRLVKIMMRLRGDQGCPWDKEQDHRSLKRYLLEETYEVMDAIDRQDMYNICEELGDLLLQIAFHAQIASENGYFDINDVVDAISKKMIRRHPHVFGGATVKGSKDVIANWSAIKAREKGGKAGNSILDGITDSLPALMKAQKVQAKAAGAGFDWPDYRGALEKVYEELNEIQEAIETGDSEQKENEMGDVIFAAVNLSRLIKVDAESALIKTVLKFTERYRYIEQKAALSGRDPAGCTIEEMDLWWEEAKKTENCTKK